MKPWRNSLVLGASIAVILCAASIAGARPDTKPAQVSDPARLTGASNPAKPPSGAADNSDYVGTDTCKACHEDIYNNYEKTPHWKTLNDSRGGPSKQGCEGCHGPGAAHVAGGGDKTKIFIFKDHSAKEIDDRCMTCHASSNSHLNAINSEHAKSGVSCISCHSPHHGQTKEFLLVRAQPELCYSCHLQQKSQFSMPFHHRVNEGLVQCSDCHNPHGTVAAKQVRFSAAQDAVCYNCHADKRGPFVFEHEAVKVEGCESCHAPHGSPNPHMLKMSNVNLLCLSCHTTSFANAPGAPSFHNQAAQYQACTLCHVQVHGSNVDHTLFK